MPLQINQGGSGIQRVGGVTGGCSAQGDYGKECILTVVGCKVHWGVGAMIG